VVLAFRGCVVQGAGLGQLEMIPAGYLAKRIEVPKGFDVSSLRDICSVSGHVNKDFADYIRYWKHNRYWLFDSPEAITKLARETSASLEETQLFYYEVYEAEFDGEKWREFESAGSVSTNVVQPVDKALYGFDIVTFYGGNAPECSPLSCNSMAKEIPTNEHCLFRTFDEAYRMLSDGLFKNAEPGPYRIFAVYSVVWK
jgi:hypothetical protein